MLLIVKLFRLTSTIIIIIFDIFLLFIWFLFTWTNSREKVGHFTCGYISLLNDVTLLCFQTTLCYYDVKDALTIDPDHVEASHVMAELERKAEDYRKQANNLNLMGRHRDALQKISIAIETNPSVPEFHVLRYLQRVLTFSLFKVLLVSFVCFCNNNATEALFLLRCIFYLYIFLNSG